MTAYVAVVGAGGPDSMLPDGCVAALRLPGASAATIHSVAGFSCAAAQTRPDSAGLFVAGPLVVVGDIRLDGRNDLLRALRGAGVATDAISGAPNVPDDVAVVCSAYRTWGAQAVDRLRGDFSFALWDSDRRELVAARDGLGVRPLYHASVAGGLCVSNTLDAVRGHPGVGVALNASAVVSFLERGGNWDTSTTTFAAIARLAPGTLLVQGIGSSAPRVRTHWTIPDPAPLCYRRADDYVDHFRALLDEAVRDRITGPTLILLSGGLDSTSIAATARRIAPATELSALTTRMPAVEPRDEMDLAKAVALRLRMAHRSVDFDVVASPGDPMRTPEPFDDIEPTATAVFNDTLARTAPVVLKGEDGDALFSPPALSAMMRRESPLVVLGRVAAHTMRHWHHPYFGWWILRRVGLMPHRGSRPRPAWITAAPPPVHTPPPIRNAARPEAAARLGLASWQTIHQSTDRAFTNAPIEFRWPLFDSRLLEFVFAIPAIPWCQRKFLLRRAFARELPEAVLRRPKTSIPGYFDAAVAEWRSRSGASFAPLHPHTREFVDPEQLAETFRIGDADDVFAGWRALSLDRWLRTLEAS